MKFNITLDTDNYPEFFGEYLRNEFFDQSKGFGCYSTFETRSGVIRLSDQYDPEEEITWQCFRKTINDVDVDMKYYWDGDGTLCFNFPDGSGLFNNDCKKSSTWEAY